MPYSMATERRIRTKIEDARKAVCAIQSWLGDLSHPAHDAHGRTRNEELAALAKSALMVAAELGEIEADFAAVCSAEKPAQGARRPWTRPAQDGFCPTRP